MEKLITARGTAFSILYNIEKDNAYVNLELKKQLKNSKHSDMDKALITELVNGVIKHKITLDYIISSFSKIKPNKISLRIRIILRLGIYQIRYLDKIPVSAACNESVKLARKNGHSASVGFVNAILRNVIRNKSSIKFPDKDKNHIEYLMTYYSYPEWIIKEWVKSYGYDFTEELCKASNDKPQVCLRTNTLKVSPDELTKTLSDEGIIASKGKYLEECLYIEKSGDLASLDSYKKGFFQVQDESSMLVSKILNPQPGELIMDVCCAPGGKTTHIAQLMKNEGKIIGWDIHPHKIELVNSTSQRLGITNIELSVQDATSKSEHYINKADRVLVDAPCSGLGILRRKPDIKWNRDYKDLDEMNKLQKDILNTVSHYVRHGGILIYSTCTLGDKENINVIDNFIERHPEFELVSIENCIDKKIVSATAKKGYIQLFPNKTGTDGFFICKMKRKAIG